MAVGALAQSETDVLRFSQTYMKGSARFTAMGGAFGALGGDMSSFMINPAGVGVYRSSEFTFSTGIFNSNQKINYDGYRTFDGHTSVNVGSSGVVLNLFNKQNDDGLKNFNIGVSYNRVNDFNSNISLVGSEGATSMMDVFKAGVNGQLKMGDPNHPADGTLNGIYEPLSKSDWKHKLAWMNFLLDVDAADKNNPNADQYYVPLGAKDKVQPMQIAEVRGFKDVVNLAFGTNIMDVVYVGSSLNITNVNYHSQYTYSERAAAGNESDFSFFNFDQFYDAYGTGVSLSVGAILKPIQELRIGISYESPTWIHMNETYTASMNSNYNQQGDVSAPSEPSYRINTPQRVTGSLAAVLGNFLILSADVDWLNYDGMLLKTKDTGNWGIADAKRYDSRINGYIEDDFRNTINVRVGAEMKMDKFAFRAGYQRYKNPYMDGIITDHPVSFYSLPGSTGGWNNQGGEGVNKATDVYSAGFGYRTRSFFIDFAYSLMTMKDSYSLYDFTYKDKDGKDQFIYSGTATSNINRNSYIVTLGFKF
jgi:hypothetical protein